MYQLDLIVVKKVVEEVTGRKIESLPEERGKDHDFFSIGCWDVLPFGKPTLKDHAVWEEMILN
jgi:hypothetical protein